MHKYTSTTSWFSRINSLYPAFSATWKIVVVEHLLPSVGRDRTPLVPRDSLRRFGGPTPTFVVDSCYEPKHDNSDNNPRSRSTPTATMRSFATIVSLLLAYCTAVYATALTYRLDAHEKACFFANVEHKGTKVAFYFAVQSGGSFDIDYSVVGPGSNGGQEKVILDGTKERQGDFVFTANEVGEYRFCFNNEMSTFAEKLVDFEIAVRLLPFKPLLKPAHAQR